MRAERYDVTVATGAAWSATYVRYTPGPAVPASAVSAGERVYVDGVPRLVASVRGEGIRVTLTFGEGTYADDRLTLVATDLISPAEAVPLVEAVAAWETSPVVNLYDDPVTVEIPTTIEPDGVTVTLSLGADETALLAPDEGAHSWDLYVRTADADWQRALEGTLTIVRGDAR